MNVTKLPVCYYPTTTILIDDNENFLTQMSNFLKTKNFPCAYYSDPKKALNYINQEYQNDPFASRCLMQDHDRNIDSFTLTFDYRKVHHEIYNPHRFRQVSVVVVDYAMPAQDGLTVCRQIEDQLCTKLLLTGEVGSNFAVKAFNDGAINKFIQKGATDLPDIFVECLQDLQHKYFINLTEAILTKVKADLFKQTPLCLSDPEFIKLFNQILRDNCIVEYYLLDEHGSFLMLDDEGKTNWLLVKSEQDMTAIIEQAQDQHACAEILSALSNRTLVPYFHTDEDWNIGYDDVDVSNYLHPASSIRGNQVYHYSYVRADANYQLDWQKLSTLRAYMSEVELCY